MQYIHAEFGFGIGFVLRKNSSVTLPYTRDKGVLPWQPILMTEIAINAFIREIARMWLVITVFVISQCKEDISDCKGLTDIAIWQTIFGQNRQKHHKNGHNFSCMRHIHAEIGFEIEFVLSGSSSVTLPYIRDKGALPCVAWCSVAMWTPPSGDWTLIWYACWVVRSSLPVELARAASRTIKV